ncbi:MAG TPA: hypothetical protein DCG23_09475, partial [Deltaproteobacteria bacterium]|nr:hypothetical protein [Deltaproteobacteria bacterium]
MKKYNWQTKQDAKVIRQERQIAREIRKSQWWKNRRASNICYYCETSTPALQLTMDHLVPLARGGRSIKSNLVPCCKSCNTQKKNLLTIEWIEFLEKIKKIEKKLGRIRVKKNEPRTCDIDIIDY